MRDATELGASLYVPATRCDLLAIVRGEKLQEARSIILCTEDSVREDEVQLGLRNLRGALPHIRPSAERMVFVRARNPAVLSDVLAMAGVDRLDGFVLPKVTAATLPAYLRQLGRHPRHYLMPTLETREVFDEREMCALRRQLEHKSVRERVLTLRIGGNDLLSLLGMRRPRGRTLYQTPIGPVISRLVTTFKPSGFSLSAPVFEYLRDIETLVREVEEDLAHGLVGKTAIHPDQIPIIHACYRVREADLEMASKILDEDAPAVFKMDHSMCEPATHRNWAQRLIKSASCFGLREARNRGTAPA